MSLRIAKLRNKRGGSVLVSYNEVGIKPDIIKEGLIQNEKALIDIIKLAYSTVKGEKLSTKYAAISLPEEKSFSRVIQVPKMTEEELKLAVPLEAENHIPLTIDKVYLDFQTINSHKNNSSHLDLLINAIPKGIVDSYVSCFKGAGLIPCILEVEPQSIVRALVKSGEDILSTIFIDFGRTKTSFIIFSGDSIRFTSSISVSSEQLTAAISDKLGIGFEDAEELKIKYGLTKNKDEGYRDIIKIMSPILNDLVDQIKKYIDFYYGHISHDYFSSDNKIEKIVLCGGGVNLKKLPDFISEKLRIPVEIGNPFTNIIMQESKNTPVISWEKTLSFTTAFGLALRGVSGEI